MDTTLDADLELLSRTGQRHATAMSPFTCIHLSAAVDALTDPLVLPRFVGVDDDATADLEGVMRAVRTRLLHAAQHSTSVQETLAAAFAARELTQALAALTPGPSGPGHDGVPAGADQPGHPGGPGR